jgi:hypothetical protein
MHYTDPGANYYEERYKNRLFDSLTKRAAALGYVLQENKIDNLSTGVS